MFLERMMVVNEKTKAKRTARGRNRGREKRNSNFLLCAFVINIIITPNISSTSENSMKGPSDSDNPYEFFNDQFVKTKTICIMAGDCCGVCTIINFQIIFSISSLVKESAE